MIAWFVDNPIASNLLMAVLVVGGFLTLSVTRQEEFPSIDTQVIMVSVAYLGAAPEEVESGVCVRVEEAVEGISGIERVTSISAEGSCAVTLELEAGTDWSWALSEVESRVDGISSFPAQTEKPNIQYIILRGSVLQVAVSGEANERTLKTIAQDLRDGIAALPGVSQVEVVYAREDEISIEVSEQALRRHELTFDQVADAVRRSSVDMPGGTLKTAGGDILIRAKGQRYRGEEFESIVVLTRGDGTTVTLGEIANVIDGFREGDLRAYFDGRQAVMVQVFRVGDEDILESSRVVKAYIESRRPSIPEGIDLTIWNDESHDLRARLGALLRSAGGGLAFVLIVLALVLRLRLAMWVAAGIPISLIGAILFFPTLDINISTITIIGFILVLGIVVDDAIIVGERIYAYEEKDGPGRDAAVNGAQEVAIPVVFGVLTTVAAFSPLALIPGRMGQFFGTMGWVVILCLLMSLVEAQLILPAHLARHRLNRKRRGPWQRLQERIAAAFDGFVQQRYRPALDRALEWRYLSLSIACAALIITGSLFLSGRIGLQFFPGIEGDRVYASLTMPRGTPVEATVEGVRQLEAAAEELRAEFDRDRPEEQSIVRHVLASIGTQVGREGPPMGRSIGSTSHEAEVVIELVPYKERGIAAGVISERWRELTGPVTDAVELRFDANHYHAGEPVGIQLAGRDVAVLTQAAAELRHALEGYEGVLDIRDSFRSGKQEVQITLLPEAKSLGLQQQDLAQQVRTAFYGVEVQRVQRGSEDIRVMVRYPEDERRSIGDLEAMRIRTPDGIEVPFSVVARAELGRGFAEVRRTDGMRVVTVTAEVDRLKNTPEDINRSLSATVLPQILNSYPGVTYSVEGELRERSRAIDGLTRAYAMALLVIYAMLAVPLRSYSQPLIIMSAIPFGAVGAVLGHFVMGSPLEFFSVLGMVALSGVVVNDSLVMVDYMNRLQRQGRSLVDAVREAGAARFRAIFLTSATTFAGLAPIMFSVSPVTGFAKPIAVSLGYGVVLATGLTLFIVPCARLILDDIERSLRGKRKPLGDTAGAAAMDTAI